MEARIAAMMSFFMVVSRGEKAWPASSGAAKPACRRSVPLERSVVHYGHRTTNLNWLGRALRRGSMPFAVEPDSSANMTVAGGSSGRSRERWVVRNGAATFFRTAGCAASRPSAQARSPMDKPWTTPCVAHRLTTGRRLPTKSTVLDPVRIESGKVKTNPRTSALAYSGPVAVQATVTTAIVKE